MSETKFDTNGNLQNFNYNINFVDIRNVNKYVFMHDSYYGCGGYTNGNYLLPFARESWLESRKALSSYRNFIKPIINAIVEPVFNEPIIRKTTNKIFEDFLTNVDNKYNNINDHCLEVATLSRIHGTVFVVVDNLVNAQLPATEQEVIKQRAYPYIYIQPAYTVKEFTTDYYGNLETITFEGCTTYNDKPAKLFTTWTAFEVIEEIKVDDKIVSTEVSTHNLGILPVIPVCSTIDKEILPTPPFYDIARINYNIFNKDSEVRDQERSQAFSIFYMQTDMDPNNIEVGPHNAIIIPAGNDINITPGYCSPDSNILTVLNANTEKLIESIYKAAQDNGIAGIRQQTSGVAESYKFRGTNRQLQRTAKICETYEKKLAIIFGKYINQEIDYTVKYSMQYEPNIGIENIDATIKLLSIELPEDIKVQIKKELIYRTLAYLDKDTLDNLLSKIDINT